MHVKYYVIHTCNRYMQCRSLVCLTLLQRVVRKHASLSLTVLWSSCKCSVFVLQLSFSYLAFGVLFCVCLIICCFCSQNFLYLSLISCICFVNSAFHLRPVFFKNLPGNDLYLSCYVHYLCCNVLVMQCCIACTPFLSQVKKITE